MRRFLVPLLLVTLAVPLGASVPYRDSTRAQWFLDRGPFDSMETFFGAADERKMLEAGVTFNAYDDTEGEYKYFWAIEADSSAWIQAPSGQMMLVDPYIFWKVGQAAEKRMGYRVQDLEGIGYGWEAGRLYLYFTQSAPVWWVIGFAVAALLGSVVGVVRLIRNLRRSQERERQLADSRRRIVDSREDERLGLSRDLHDGPLQDLQVLRMQLGVAEHSVSEGEPVELLRDRVAGVQGELLRVIDEVRQISEGLRPPVLSSFGLAAAVRGLVKRMQPQAPETHLHLDAEDEGADLSEPVRLTLYRVAQEGLNNALSHADASTVTVRFWRTPAEAHLAVEDDGHGFAVPAELHAFELDGHLGLAGMAERASALGGTLAVQSTAAGTRIHISIPQPTLQPA